MPDQDDTNPGSEQPTPQNPAPGSGSPPDASPFGLAAANGSTIDADALLALKEGHLPPPPPPPENYWDFLDDPDPEEEQANLGIRVQKRDTTKLISDFKVFHQANPMVYSLLVKYAREWRQAHPTWHLGIGMIYEILRWRVAMTTVDTTSKEPKKLSNNHRAYYARLIMSKEIDLREIFVVKVLDSQRNGMAAQREREKARLKEEKRQAQEVRDRTRARDAEEAQLKREHRQKVRAARTEADTINRANAESYRAAMAARRAARDEFRTAKSAWNQARKNGTLPSDAVEPAIPAILLEPAPSKPRPVEPVPVPALDLRAGQTDDDKRTPEAGEGNPSGNQGDEGSPGQPGAFDDLDLPPGGQSDPPAAAPVKPKKPLGGNAGGQADLFSDL